jgi:hypothetical protein
MSNSIHLTTARKILDSHDPVDLAVWKKNGEIMRLKNCVSISYNYYSGTRNIKLLNSGQIRMIRDICIFQINNLNVFI